MTADVVTYGVHTDVRCPLPSCPTVAIGRPVGTLTVAVGELHPWRMTTAHRPGHVQSEDHPYAAIRWILAQHTLHEHDLDRVDPPLTLAMTAAARVMARQLQGLPPLVDLNSTVATCSFCDVALHWDAARSVWVDDGDDLGCPGTAQLCDRFCRPHGRSHVNDQPCGLCGGHGALLAVHEPIVDVSGIVTDHQDGDLS